MENSIVTPESNWKKNIIYFLLSQSISLFGSSIVQYAIIWHITLTTQSGMMMTLSTICGFLPQILISIFAGVWADRYSKKFLIMVSDSCIAISTLILAIFFLTGFYNIWLLFIGLAIRSLGSGVQTPAVNSLIPELVPEKHLMRVNGINGTLQSIILIASPAISGALISILPIGSIFFVDVITALIGVGVFSVVKTSYTRKTDRNEKINYLADFKDGLKYIKNNKFIKTFFVFFSMFYIFFGPMGFLTPLLIARTFGDEVWRLTANEIVFFIGTILGGVLIATWGGFKNKIYTITLSSLIYSICSIIMGLPLNFIVYLVMMAAAGFGMSLMQSPSTVIIQESVEESMLGRVFSIVQILSASIMPLSMLVYGPLADAFSVEILLLITGVLTLILTGFIATNKTLINGVRITDKNINANSENSN